MFDSRRRLVIAGLLVAGVVAVLFWFLSYQTEKETSRTLGRLESTLSSDEFDRRIHDYLTRHPEVIAEAARSLQQRQAASGADELKAIVAAHSDEIFHDAASPVGGNPKGDVSVVEFFDYNCPYCRANAPIVQEAQRGDPQLRLVYKEFPILGPNSEFAARAALASIKQGKYVAFHEALYSSKGPATEETVMDVAKSIGIDTTQLRKDMEDPAVKGSIEHNLELARTLRITGTPSFVIGDQLHIGLTDLGTLQALVSRARRGQ